MAKSEEELKSLLMKVKEESGKAGLKLNIHVNVWHKPLQYCKVILLKLIKINFKKIAEKRREVKGKGEKERYNHLNA